MEVPTGAHPQGAAEGGAESIAVLWEPPCSAQRRRLHHKAGIPPPRQSQCLTSLGAQLLRPLRLQLQATPSQISWLQAKDWASCLKVHEAVFSCNVCASHQ